MRRAISASTLRAFPAAECRWIAAASAATQRLKGVVDAWHFVDRVGAITIVDPTTGEQRSVKIQGTKSFESLMPTSHRDLKGTAASFTLSEDGQRAESIILELGTAPVPRFEATVVPPVYGRQDISSGTLRVKAYETIKQEEAAKRAKYLEERKSGSVTVVGTSARVVCPETMKGVITHWSAIHRSGLIEVESSSQVKLRYVIQKTQDFVDAMPTSLSLIGASAEFRPVHTHVLLNAAEVLNAMNGGAYAGGAPPALRGLVQLGECTNMVAEDIVITAFPAKPSTASEQLKKLSDDEMAVAAAAAVVAGDAEFLLDGEGPHYGIVTRWSGGQGIVEGGNGKAYYLENANAFSTFDPGQAAIRGAVVQFQQDPNRLRYATNVIILTELTGKSGGVGEPSMTPTKLSLDTIDARSLDEAAAAGDFDYGSFPVSETGSPGAIPQPTEARGSNDAPDPLAHLEQRRGRVVTFSKSEKTGIIEEIDDGTGKGPAARFVLRDASRDVVGFATPRIAAAFERGCTVTFVAVGVSGRIAGRVVLQTTKKGEEIQQAPATPDGGDLSAASPAAAADGATDGQQPAASEDEKPADEAIASPTAVGYWLQRFERIGANMSEYRKVTEKLTPPTEEDEKDFADDPWFKDPKRNKKVRGDASVGDMMTVQPAGLMNLGMKMSDPTKLSKEIKKYERRLPDEVRVKCMTEAKGLAPKFLTNMQAQKARSGEVTFNFFK